MAILADNVRQTTTTTGTGIVTLDGTVSGKKTFFDGLTTLDYTKYVIRHENGIDFETGYGQFTGTGISTDTLSRAFLQSSSTGSLLNLSAGTHEVFIGNSAVSDSFHGAMLDQQTDVTVTNVVTTLIGENEVYDTDNIWDVGQPTRLTVPDWASYVRLSGNAAFTANVTGSRNISCFKNGASTNGFDGLFRDLRLAANTTTYMNATSGIVSVQPNDYFELGVFQSSGGNLDMLAAWFAMEVIQ